MTQTILQRLTALCDKPTTPIADVVCSILRKLRDQDPVDKLTVIANHLRKLTPEEQARVLDVVNGLIDS